MRRRDFVGALVLGSFTGRASAQQSLGTKRMAIVQQAGRIQDMRIGGDGWFTVGHKELERLGFVEGQNLIIDRYSAEGNKERYPELAREVVSTRPDLITTVGSPLTRALLAATTTIPIVTVTGDPIRQGLITNIARPGGNLTGVSVDAGFELWGKRLEMLAEALPKLRTAVLVSTGGPWDAAAGKVTREAANKLGISLINGTIYSPINEVSIRKTFETVTSSQADGIMFSYEPELYVHRFLIVELVRQARIPAIYTLREQAEAGGLMAYADDVKQAARLQAQQQAEVLRGGKPSEMPYLQATKYELVINLKTAKQLGLELPPAFIARADEVIE
jgi:putative ABC transport system substrate-binding protein